ncbi:MAG: SIMPL domain-containing protein [Stagnimonas sp.]|nr:SIMPL domain-containing protein [Stagnimonas sp.]
MRHLPLAVALLAFSFAASAAEPAPRVVQVTGQGEATVAPDRARLSMAIEARNADLRAAETKVNDGTRAVLKELKGLGLKDEDISTAGYSVNPEYDWVDNQHKFRAYFARREINVTVRNLDKVGDVLLRLTKAGVNQVNAPVLESSKMKETERAALARAVADAAAQASVIAEGLSLKLGLPRTVNASSQAYNPPVPMPRLMAMKASSDGAPEMSGNEQTGFSAGLIHATSTLTAEFELLP